MKKWRLVYLAIPLTVLVFAGIAMKNGRTAGEEPAEGIGRVPTVQRYAAPAQEEEIPSLPAYDEYVEGESPVPVWWNPDEPMAAEWVADVPDINVGHKDIGCPDYNVETVIYGWNGHSMEAWEMDLFSRIVYLEFWGTSEACVEAGIDSMLLLWDMGEYGRTMGELLSAQYAPGYYVYSPYAYVWEWDYDAEALAGIRAMCESRFAAGPEWCAPYFRLWYYHEWAVPAYEIDGVYFSVPRG